MKFRLLGPLEVVVDGARLPVRASKLRVLLASLLVDANRVVPFDELMANVWDDELPTRTALHNLVMRLRHALGSDVIRTHADGYLVAAGEADLDLSRFEALIGRAKAERDPARISALLTEALELWRGEPLADVPSEVLHRAVVPGLVERRLMAIEQRVEADLALGRHHDLIAELGELTDRHPLREHFWAQRMLALHRSGRQADALSAYRAISGILADELGVDPGQRLREAHQQVLNGDLGTAAGGHLVPRQLPTRTPHFVGREEELHLLGKFLGMTGETVVISALGGAGGIGKTTLAVHWAHQIADRFPDGQLYVNLRGFDAASDALQPGEAIRGFLDAFSTPPDRIPTNLQAQAALYRSLLSDRRVLVILDNARDADQVRPLLPASPTCLVLITSRNPLTSLVAREGARPVPLDLLTPDEAIDLLGNHLGHDRVAAEPAAAAELVDHCAGLPLALALMAARAAVNPRLALRDLTRELRDAQRRLDALDADEPDNGVRAVFSWSYRQLTPAAARMFRLLGVHRGPDISLAAAASLAGTPLDETRQVLDELTKAHLVNEDSQHRFALHDLLRAYAAEQSDDGRQAALRRVLDHYLHTALAACAKLYPHRALIQLAEPAPGTTPEDITDPDLALAWYNAEHQVLLATAALAGDAGFDSHAHRIPWVIASYLNHFGHHHEWVRTQRIAITATERLGDDDGRAHAHVLVGQAHGRLGDYEQAIEDLTLALDIYQKVDNALGLAAAYGSLAWVCKFLGRHDEFFAHSLRSAELYRITGHPLGECRALNAVAFAHTDLGNYEQAVVHSLQALAIARDIGDLDTEANVLDTVGVAYHRLGDHERALEYLRLSADLCVEHCPLNEQVTVFGNLGDVLHTSGDLAGARQAWRRALEIAENLPGVDVEEIRTKLRGS